MAQTKKVSELEVITYCVSREDEFLEPVEITQRRNADSVRWAILQGGACFSKDRKWVREPMPSSRTNDFFEATRFGSAQEALDFWISSKGKSRFAR
jgi:hypothetical protein